ncbi:DNA/RNA non-specific endonuclease [Enterococcus wangshanyuanii]|uniref:DNA-entry nuclease n=1 Tax=Enterococcus wangshanyuanii TaxID=2005703 RepID=A0ABQ1PTL0_9ENTE|nr:DNA/RNA non-specific endonuclease [Enterococcus wangshanyuanii]GGD03503.1 DNA-entry nuclease [Enterococcus wangshanyuanii]
MKNKFTLRKLSILAAFFFMLSGCSRQLDSIGRTSNSSLDSTEVSQQENSYSSDFPVEYDGMNQEIVLNDNKPTFSEEDLSLNNGVWQSFSDLDQLNRVGVANALIGKESFPTVERETLTIKPTGWNQKKLSDGQWLYNRCHLIGFQMTGENNNPKNLMTGTRSFNTPHMLNYENQIMDYIQLTGNHVRYRVTSHFIGDELVARGVQMEAASVETDEFAYNVYIFNVQDGYQINYATGAATKE